MCLTDSVASMLDDVGRIIEQDEFSDKHRKCERRTFSPSHCFTLLGVQTVLSPVHDLLSGWRVYLG